MPWAVRQLCQSSTRPNVAAEGQRNSCAEPEPEREQEVPEGLRLWKWEEEKMLAPEEELRENWSRKSDSSSSWKPVPTAVLCSSRVLYDDDPPAYLQVQCGGEGGRAGVQDQAQEAVTGRS